MKRRTFLITASATAAAVIISPIVYTHIAHSAARDPLTVPLMLAEFSDFKTIRKIGLDYRKVAPVDCTRGNLSKLLLTAPGNIQLDASDFKAVSDLVESKAKDDFRNARMVTMEGWVISLTEARQCALFSLS